MKDCSEDTIKKDQLERYEKKYSTNIFLKINSFIDILSNIIENFDRLALYKEPSDLKDKISALNLKFCNLQKNNGF